MANLYESLPANHDPNNCPPPPPKTTNLPPPPPATPADRKQRNNNNRRGGNKKYAPGPKKRAPPPPPNDQPRKAAAMGGAVAKSPMQEQKSSDGKSEVKSGPLQQASAQQKSDVSHHFAGVDREYHEEQTDDPAFDLANDMEHNDIYAIRINRERKSRKQRERISCLVIIFMVCIGALLTLATGIFIALDFSK